jgi:16S rRNA (adenine1518-N6/adenine1519-N6)-dimethyltransferase
MDRFSIKNHRKLLIRNKIKPLKKLGQNFLIDQKIINKIVQAAETKPDDLVLEIGPGTGILTMFLAEKAGKVISVEKDELMCQTLKENLKDQNINNVQVINQDILDFDFKEKKCFKIVANLPYYISSAVIRKFLESDNSPEKMILTVQKEVGQRIVSQPPKMNLLAVAVQFYAQPKIVCFVSKKSFWPVPKVDSAVLEIKPFNVKRKINQDLFFKVVKAGFSQPRKQLLNNLSKQLKLTKAETKNWLCQNKIKPEQRAETLTVDDWINLAVFLS